jgi:hypothetical protein
VEESFWEENTEIISSVVAQFESCRCLRGVFPKPGAVQPGEGSPIDRRMRVGDPSLRPKSGCAQDDAVHQKKSKLSHYHLLK